MNTNETVSEDAACYWVGADVGKESFDAGLLREGQHFPATRMRDVPVQTFARTPEGVQQCLRWLDALVPEASRHQVRVVMESTGPYSLELSAWLVSQRHSLAPAIINPQLAHDFTKSLGLRNTTDRLSARALALYGTERRPAPYHPPCGAWAQLRELSRYRDFLVAERVAQENHASESKPSKVVRTIVQLRERHVKQHIKRIEREMQALIARTPELQRDYALLVTIPGVAFVTAAVILAEIGDLRRFQEARQLSAFVGLSPRIHDSGTSVHHKPHLCKCGNARVRKALYLAAMTNIRYAGPLKTAYDHLIARPHEPLQKIPALCAVARKMLVMMRAIIIFETPYKRKRSAGGKLRPVCA